MAEGDSADMQTKLVGLIPGGWFARPAVVLNVVAGGLSDTLAGVYSLLAAVRAQTRLMTSTGWFVDLFAWDFLGANFLRRPVESDASFVPRVRAELFRERDTRKGIAEALVNLTGRAPQIFEPWNAGDCGALGVGTFALAGQAYAPSAVSALGVAGGLGQSFHLGQTQAATGAAFAGAGCLGSTSLPFQVFVTAYRPAGRGIPNVPGLGYGGLGTGSMELADDAAIQSAVSDAEIYQTVADTAVAGVTVWTAIES